MKIGVIFSISRAMVMAKLKQTIVAAVGVTFGISMFIALLGFMNGLNDLLDGLILNRTPHIRLYNDIKPSRVQPVEASPRYGGDSNFIRSVKPKDVGKEIYNSRVIMKTIMNDERVLGVAPKASTQVFFNTGTIEIGGVLDGIDPVAEERLFALSDYVIEGNLEDLDIVTNSIFLGKGVADKMLAVPGDVIRVTTPSGALAMLKVIGIVQFGLAEVDNVQSYTSMETAQTLMGESASYITDIQIKLKDLNLAKTVAAEYVRIFNVDAIDIQTANVQFETGSSIRSTISYAVGVTLLIVAGFGIYNILNMLIYEKMDSIAILKATGFSGYDVRLIFVFLAMMIGVSGGLAGLVFGYIFSVIISNLPFETQALPTISTYPVNFDLVYYLIGISFALITTYIAGLFPAIKASRVDPVVIIRGK